jgi:excisionase family DNA binding protein
MTIQKYRKWLEQQIQYLGNLDQFQTEDQDARHVEQVCDEAYALAVDLNLTACVAAWRPGVVGLMAMLDAIPEKTNGVYSLDEAADKLGVSRRTVSRLIEAGDLECTRIGRRVTITQKQLQAYQATEETLF